MRSIVDTAICSEPLSAADCSRNCSGQSFQEPRKTKAFNSEAANHSIENS